MGRAECMQFVDGSDRHAVERYADPNGTRQLRLGIFQRNDLADSDAWIRTLLDAHTTAYQDRDIELHLVLKPLVSLWEHQHVDAAQHVFQLTLGVQIAFL